MSGSRSRRTGALIAVIATLTLIGPVGSASRAAPFGPSAYCHVTDGMITICADGNIEWSDIPVAEFPLRNAFLYADQADLIPDRGIPGLPYDTFMLLYDECGRTAPLGTNEYFLVNFDTVETEPDGTERLERYSVHIFSDGTIVFIEDGEVQRDAQGRARVHEIDGQRGKAGYGPTPSCPFDHLVVEYEIVLEEAGGHSYSSDPLFWSGIPPNQPPVARDDDVDLLDQDQASISLLTNDSDPDGTIVPATVMVVDQPQHGSVHIGPSGVVTYEKGPDFPETDAFSYTVQDNDASTSNTATVTIVGDTCPADETVPVSLPAVNGTGTVLALLKGYRVSYDPLDLTFTTVPPRSSAYCSLDSDVGVLDVRLTCLGTGLSLCPDFFPSGVAVRVATSTAEASLDLYRPGTVPVPPLCDFVPFGDSDDCLLNAPTDGAIMARWRTGGFVIREAFRGTVLHTTDPLTFWVNLNGLVSPSAPLAEQVGRAETFIHTTLVNHLSAVDRFAIVQDPPAEILVTDQGERRTGRTRLGEVVNEIPGSVYSTSAAGASMVLILDPAASSYLVEVHGTTGESFELSMAVIDLFGDVTKPAIDETTHSGTIEPGANVYSFEVPLEQRPAGPRRAIRPGFNSTALDRDENASAGPAPLGFQIDLSGGLFSEVFVNDNGSLTFGRAFNEFTPIDLSTADLPIIAPFFADVDTRRHSEAVRYGTGAVAGRPAFGATWFGVGCLNLTGAPEVPPRNRFQVVLIDRNDIGPGDVDIEFNYDQIQWETGTSSGGDDECLGGSSARIGLATGTTEPGSFFELAGSGVPGFFLDSNGDGNALIENSRESRQPGRYHISIRDGRLQTNDDDRDGVTDDIDNCPDTVNADQHDTNLDGIGDACGPGDRLHSTAGFIHARLDGQTSAYPGGATLAEEPGLQERLVRIVRFRLAAGLTTSAVELTTSLVDSLVDMGLLPPGDAAALIHAVLSELGQPASPSPSTSPPPQQFTVTQRVTGW